MSTAQPTPRASNLAADLAYLDSLCGAAHATIRRAFAQGTLATLATAYSAAYTVAQCTDTANSAANHAKQAVGLVLAQPSNPHAAAWQAQARS